MFLISIFDICPMNSDNTTARLLISKFDRIISLSVFTCFGECFDCFERLASNFSATFSVGEHDSMMAWLELTEVYLYFVANRSIPPFNVAQRGRRSYILSPPKTTKLIHTNSSQ